MLVAICDCVGIPAWYTVSVKSRSVEYSKYTLVFAPLVITLPLRVAVVPDLSVNVTGNASGFLTNVNVPEVDTTVPSVNVYV